MKAVTDLDLEELFSSHSVRRPWAGTVFRTHHRRYSAVDATGALRVTGRYNRGRDRFSESESWPALYTTLGRDVALAEQMRHLTPAMLDGLIHMVLSELDVEL